MILWNLLTILGCKVVGTAGTDKKVEWLKKELGLDFAYNYKTVDIGEKLKTEVPEGIDCFFDNVGGSSSVEILNNMNLKGRVVVVGTISRLVLIMVKNRKC